MVKYLLYQVLRDEAIFEILASSDGLLSVLISSRCNNLVLLFYWPDLVKIVNI